MRAPAALLATLLATLLAAAPLAASAQQDAPRQDAPKQEAPKQDAPKQDAPKQDGPMQEAPAPQTAPEQPAPAQQTPPTRAAPPDATRPAPGPDDFELLPPEKAPDAEQRAREQSTQSALHTRRTMLQLHQIGGLATLAAMGTSVVLGQLNYNDKYGAQGDTGTYRTAHQISVYTTTGLFAATGLLALFAPSPFDKPLRLDTATLHKASMIVATAGMAAQIALGIVTKNREGSISQRDFALAHQIIGYTTFAATATGFTVLLF